ncbi:hypothetical protein [Streptomyces geranii]|uniref:hypothetical protein n=1 Tax=Streptomyces geranii TaxID=2058923 RepID=UPI001E4B0D49|nr:hypothetical protein [Streptomyces geranii]
MGGLSTRRPGRAAVLAVACLAVALSAGCTGGDKGSAGAERTTAAGSTESPDPSENPPSPSPTTQRAEHVEGETVTKAPQVVDGKVLAAVADARGGQVLPLGGLRSGPVSIAVNCQGKGTLTVELRPVGLSFPLECVAGEVSSTYNQIALKNPRTDAVVQVTASSGVRWALSVGQ